MATDTYLIKATPTQVRWLEIATNQAMRIHIGQLTDPLTVYLNFITAYERHHNGQHCPLEVEEILEGLSRQCWVNTPHGYAYSEKARMLWKMYQLFKKDYACLSESCFTLTRSELVCLRDALEQASRLKVGQVSEAMLEELLSAYKRSHEKDAEDFRLMHQIRDSLSHELAKLLKICWDLSPNASYGLGYDSVSDGWWSMYEVIRYLLWKEDHPYPSPSDRLSVSSYPPMALGEKPLLKVMRE